MANSVDYEHITNRPDCPFNFLDNLQHQGQVYIKSDAATGLIAIIAIHSLALGPSLGGCRFLSYPSVDLAVADAVRLAKSMSYKAAISRVPYGGGKAVIIKPAYIQDRKAYFKSFANFVTSLGGNYITTMDSGLDMADLDSIAADTAFVTGHTGLESISNDPAPYTAEGVYQGIKAAVKFKWQRSDLSNLHIAIQGLGNVGYLLAKKLLDAGAKLTVCEINPQRVKQLQEEASVNVVSPNEIYQVECDIFAPCSLGLILNEQTLPLLKASIIAGCANNQLLSEQIGIELSARGILYAPDYVINAGGLIKVAGQYSKLPEYRINEQVHNIFHTLSDIFQRSRVENKPTNKVADEMAESLLANASSLSKTPQHFAS